MEDYMGQNSSSSNTNNTSTAFLYGSSGGDDNSGNLYGRGGNESDPAGGFDHYPMVKIETEKFFNCPPSVMTSFNHNENEALKAKIISHPHYSNLLQAYMDCQKVGAPPEVVGRLSAVRQEYEARQRANLVNSGSRENYKDPELDQFMEAYYDMLTKYKEELTRPIQEAMEFMRRIESQLSTLSVSSSSSSSPAAGRISFISPGSVSNL